MNRTPRSRAFERTLRAPSRLVASLAGQQAGREGERRNPRQFFYQRLMQVAVRHTYYNGDDFLCPDFGFAPTPASAALMARLGMIFRPEEAGFSVLYDETRAADLLRYLRRGANDESQVWTRLSFLLALESDYFVNLTDMPIHTQATAENFYFTNQDAHPSAGLLLLNRGSRAGARQLLPVAPGQLPVPMEINGQYVDEAQIRDISGRTVLCVPRCVSFEAVRDKLPENFTCDDKGDYRCAGTVYINFSSLPEDKYTLELLDAVGQPVMPPADLLWTTFYPMPLCFIDLLFTSPAGEKPENYPVRGLFSDHPEIVTTSYTLHFERRSTLWNYYIVPPQPDTLEDLRIENHSPFPVEFVGPCRVLLPDGREAFRFLSKQPLPLQQQPEHNFRLKGRHKHWPHERTLVDRLPGASSQQVLPEMASTACAELRSSLCPRAAEDPACRKLADRVCRSAGPRRRNFSDIFVYV